MLRSESTRPVPKPDNCVDRAACVVNTGYELVDAGIPIRTPKPRSTFYKTGPKVAAIKTRPRRSKRRLRNDSAPRKRGSVALRHCRPSAKAFDSDDGLVHDPNSARSTNLIDAAPKRIQELQRSPGCRPTERGTEGHLIDHLRTGRQGPPSETPLEQRTNRSNRSPIKYAAHSPGPRTGCRYADAGTPTVRISGSLQLVEPRQRISDEAKSSKDEGIASRQLSLLGNARPGRTGRTYRHSPTN